MLRMVCIAMFVAGLAVTGCATAEPESDASRIEDDQEQGSGGGGGGGGGSY
jgi:hypothetical protein